MRQKASACSISAAARAREAFDEARRVVGRAARRQDVIALAAQSRRELRVDVAHPAQAREQAQRAAAEQLDELCERRGRLLDQVALA